MQQLPDLPATSTVRVVVRGKKSSQHQLLKHLLRAVKHQSLQRQTLLSWSLATIICPSTSGFLWTKSSTFLNQSTQREGIICTWCIWNFISDKGGAGSRIIIIRPVSNGETIEANQLRSRGIITSRRGVHEVCFWSCLFSVPNTTRRDFSASENLRIGRRNAVSLSRFGKG